VFLIDPGRTRIHITIRKGVVRGIVEYSGVVGYGCADGSIIGRRRRRGHPSRENHGRRGEWRGFDEEERRSGPEVGGVLRPPLVESLGIENGVSGRGGQGRGLAILLPSVAGERESCRDVGVGNVHGVFLERLRIELLQVGGIARINRRVGGRRDYRNARRRGRIVGDQLRGSEVGEGGC